MMPRVYDCMKIESLSELVGEGGCFLGGQEGGCFLGGPLLAFVRLRGLAVCRIDIMTRDRR